MTLYLQTSSVFYEKTTDKMLARPGATYRPASEAEILAAAGAITSARRKTRKGGRPKQLSKCKGCGLNLGVREMRLHKCPVLVLADLGIKTVADLDKWIQNKALADEVETNPRPPRFMSRYDALAGFVGKTAAERALRTLHKCEQP